MIGFADAYADLNSDFIVLLGDRFEIFSAAASAMVHAIHNIEKALGDGIKKPSPSEQKILI